MGYGLISGLAGPARTRRGLTVSDIGGLKRSVALWVNEAMGR